MPPFPTIHTNAHLNNYIMEKNKEKRANALRLTRKSTKEQIRQYFMNILELSRSSREYPVNLDDIWEIAYPRKDHAVRALRAKYDVEEDFIVKKSMQNADYQFFPKNGENLKGGRPTEHYYLTLSCAEHLVVRENRMAFEVYRQVFHAVAGGGIPLLGLGRYYTITEYCQMFGKARNSFYGLMAGYREEFIMIGSVYYISKALCRMLEMKGKTEQMKSVIRKRGEERQLKLEFKDDDEQ